jgi:hypothetical protein
MMIAAAPSRFPPRFWYGVAAALFVAQIVILYLMGRIPICECGYIKLFEPGVNSPGNSQHLADWYTPSHIIHGFIFFWFAWLLFRQQSIGFKLAFAVLVEAAWEVLENTPIVIDHYRSATMAVGYTGDSILNSAMDTVWMVLGFYFALKMPIWVTVTVAIIFEVFTGWLIRDNLTLNVLMLVFPIEAIKTWQGAL